MGYISRTLAAALENRMAFLEDGGFVTDPADFFDELCPFDRCDDLEPKTLEDGRYPARVTGIEESDDFVEFYFEISCGEWAGTEICGDVENDLSRESEAREWVESILGRCLEGDERIDFDVDKLVGKRCEVKVRTSFGSPSVVAVYGSSSEDPELEELLLKEEVLRHDPFDSASVRYQCEQSRQLLRETEALLAERRADRANGGR